MADNPMKKLMESRRKQSPPTSISPLPDVEVSSQSENPEVPETTQPEATSPPPSNPSSPTTTKRKRGRPATGKRSDPGWIGRTYYIQEATDIDVEMELALLRRQGVDLDKSELVDSLLAAWVQWRKGKDSESLIGEITPRRKGK
jgi:hypothetical protein